MSSTSRLCACAVSTISTSTPASTSVIARVHESSPTPTAAPTSSRPSLSLVANGNCSVLTKSLTVISPVSLPCPSTIGSFSILLRRNRPSAASAETPACAVISGALVITSETGLDWSTSNRMSRLVMMPTSCAGVVDDRQPGDPEPRAHRVDLGQRVVRRAGDRVGDHAGFRALDRLDLAGLLGHGKVAVKHAHAACAGHRDRHPRLGDGVHRRADQRHPQPDLAGSVGWRCRLWRAPHRRRRAAAERRRT